MPRRGEETTGWSGVWRWLDYMAIILEFYLFAADGCSGRLARSVRLLGWPDSLESGFIRNGRVYSPGTVALAGL